MRQPPVREERGRREESESEKYKYTPAGNLCLWRYCLKRSHCLQVVSDPSLSQDQQSGTPSQISWASAHLGGD